MKNLTFFLFAAFISFCSDLSAGSMITTTTTSCNWKSWFKYPQHESSYEEGKDLYVRMDPERYQDIEYVELYLNDKMVRKETEYPYEWCKGSGDSDSYLRRLKCGTYKLKCKIKDKCGQYHEIYCTFHIKCESVAEHCDYKVWFKYPQNEKYFDHGSSVYVYVDAERYNSINYVELYLNDKLVRKESQYPYEWAQGNGNTDGYLRNLQPGTYKLKARVYDKCGKYKDFYCIFHVKGDHGHGQQHCVYKSWYEYPKNNSNYKCGENVYVKINTEKYQDIEEMELYVNGKFVRKESSYPYEWCKGGGDSDGYLRNLKAGTYDLKCRVKTKCGEWHEYFCKFYVK